MAPCVFHGSVTLRHWAFASTRTIVEPVCHITHNPIKTCNQVLPCNSTTGPYPPVVALDIAQVESLFLEINTQHKQVVEEISYMGYFLVAHRALYVLLVGEHQKRSTGKSLKTYSA